MSELCIYSEKPAPGRIATPEAVVTDPAEIGESLQAIDVLFEQWNTADPPDTEASQDEIIEAYRQPVDHLMQRYALECLDVVGIYPDHPKREELREKFLQEHTHAGFEVRFFADGEALIYIRTREKVYGVLCRQGDLISVPADMAHWCDIGDAPYFKAIRLFASNASRVSRFTGDSPAECFPLLENATAAQGS